MLPENEMKILLFLPKKALILTISTRIEADSVGRPAEALARSFQRRFLFEAIDVVQVRLVLRVCAESIRRINENFRNETAKLTFV